MSAYLMTTAEKLRGVRKGIRKLKTLKRKRKHGPFWLIPGMERYAAKLEEQLAQERKRGENLKQ